MKSAKKPGYNYAYTLLSSIAAMPTHRGAKLLLLLLAWIVLICVTEYRDILCTWSGWGDRYCWLQSSAWLESVQAEVCLQAPQESDGSRARLLVPQTAEAQQVHHQLLHHQGNPSYYLQCAQGRLYIMECLLRWESHYCNFASRLQAWRMFQNTQAEDSSSEASYGTATLHLEASFQEWWLEISWSHISELSSGAEAIWILLLQH